MEHDVRIKDSEFEKLGANVKSFSDLLGNAINQYKSVLDSMLNNALCSGDVHDALEVYIQYVDELVGKPEVIGKKFQKMTKSFIKDIDKADKFLYEKGSTFVRDFSSEEKEKLLNMIKDPGWFDCIGDYIRGKLIKWFHADDVTNPKADLDACHKHLLDYNDATKKTINEIFSNVTNIDKKYGRSIAGAAPGDYDFYTSNFACAALALYSLRDAFEKMAFLIEPGKGRFTPDNIKSSLDSVFRELRHYYNETVDIIADDQDVTIEQIERFAQQFLAASFFAGFSAVYANYLADIGGKETAMMIIFNMFDVAEGEITSLGHYEQKVIKSELMNILNEMAENEAFSDSQEKASLDNFELFFKYYKKYGEKWYEVLNNTHGKDGKLLLDGRTKDAKAFKSFLSSLGNAKKILDYGEEGIEIIYNLFADYSKNLDILESFKRNCSNNDNMSVCVKEIENIYKKNLDGILSQFTEKAAEIGYKEAVGLLAKKLAPVQVVQAIKATIGTVGEVTQLGDKYQSMYDSIIYSDMYYSSTDAYKNALAKVQQAIKDGTNSGDEYLALIEDLKNSFSLSKNTAVKMFRAMASASSGDKRGYYDYCADVAEDCTMDTEITSASGYSFMSYDEYVAMGKYY